MIRAVIACLVLLLSAQSASAQLGGARLALVIGIQDYRPDTTPPQRNIRTARDGATAVAQALHQIGFEIVNPDAPGQALLNADAQRIRAALALLHARSEGARDVVIFFQGHGLQIGNDQYLVPVDLPPQLGGASIGAYVPLSEFVSAPRSVNRVFFIDACRNPNSPDADQPPRAPALAFSEVANVSIIMSTAPNHYAYPTTTTPGDTLSPFVRSLVNRLLMPGSSLQNVMNGLEADVTAATATPPPPQKPSQFGNFNDLSAFYFQAANATGNQTAPLPSQNLRPDAVAGSDLDIIAQRFPTTGDSRALFLEYTRGHSVESLRDLATNGDLNAAYLVSVAYDQGLLGARNPAMALQWAQRAAPNSAAPDAALDRRERAGLHQLGRAAMVGMGRDIDLNRAVELLTRAANAGFTKSNVLLARISFCRPVSPDVQDRELASTCTERPLRQGRRDHPADDVQRALSLWRRAASGGAVDGQFDLGRRLFVGGAGVSQNVAEGVSLLEQAAAAGSGNADLFLCTEYYGTDQRRDYANALQRCQRASNAGVRFAQARLGRAYARGDPLVGRQRNVNLAFDLLATAVQSDPSAAQALDPCAFYLLSDMFERGIGTSRNPVAANRVRADLQRRFAPSVPPRHSQCNLN